MNQNPERELTRTSNFPDYPEYQVGMDITKVHSSMMREHEQRKKSEGGIPLWMIVFFSAVIFWGGAYLAFYSGGFRADVFNETQVSYDVPKPQGPAQAESPVVIGKRVYKTTCLQCHQATGLGQPGQYPPLAGSEWVLGPSSRLIPIILLGLEGPIQVKGETYGSIAMPPWQDNLSDDKVAVVLTYIRQEWGNKASPISAEEVAAIRAKYKGRGASWKAPELLAIPAENGTSNAGAPQAPASKG